MKDIIAEAIEEKLFVHITPLQSLVDTIIDEFSDMVEKWCEDFNKDMVLDFTNVDYLSSRGITCLIRFYKLQHENGKKVFLANVSNEIKNLLKAVNITSIITIFDTIEEFLLWTDSRNVTVKSTSSVKITIEKQDDIAIMRLQGEEGSVDGSHVDFNSALLKEDSDRIIIDLGNVDRFDESSISSLVNFADSVKKKDRKLILSGVSDVNMTLFRIVGIDELFEFSKTIDDAISTISE